MAILYNEVVQWYCNICQDEGEASSQRSAEREAEQHVCEKPDD